MKISLSFEEVEKLLKDYITSNYRVPDPSKIVWEHEGEPNGVFDDVIFEIDAPLHIHAH